MRSDKKSPNPTYVSAKVSKCHPGCCGSTEFGSCVEESLLWKDVRRMNCDYSRWDSYRKQRFGHWEDPSSPNIWRMHHLVSHPSITQCPVTERDMPRPGLWERLSILPGRNRVSQEWGILSATLCSNRRLGASSGLGLIGSGQGYVRQGE